MILVTGATGHLGNAAIQSLLEKGVPANEITALVRDENKATNLKDRGVQIKIGNYNDYHSLKDALHGVDKLFLISSNDVTADTLLQHKNVINAAKENGVQHIVYISQEIKDDEITAIPFVIQIHRATAEYIKETGVVYTIFNDSLYADSIGKFSGETFLENGIFFPAGDGKVPFVPRTDIGEAAAVVLTTPGHDHMTYAITANTAYSFEDISVMLSAITGKEVKYLKPDLDTYSHALINAGVPKEVVGFLGAFATAIKNGEFDTNRSHLEILLGRKPMELKEFLKITYGK
ncbi:SDR family oxidoreductase [Mucilaginibacter sp. cycad4]|uniref:SDR family oxidoreductase n=1 Tax=Mucilaginibacter sp. cycad4 TaxID=3342096 RepID=UPI002AAA7A9C|nr:SDR family oxidoreductase [Mucilaginibacter gossypii]WPU97888.1 SDR family oxidoreductase [Mucilaginibacter gossypii]